MNRSIETNKLLASWDTSDEPSPHHWSTAVHPVHTSSTSACRTSPHTTSLKAMSRTRATVHLTINSIWSVSTWITTVMRQFYRQCTVTHIFITYNCEVRELPASSVIKRAHFTLRARRSCVVSFFGRFWASHSVRDSQTCAACVFMFCVFNGTLHVTKHLISRLLWHKNGTISSVSSLAAFWYDYVLHIAYVQCISSLSLTG